MLSLPGISPPLTYSKKERVHSVFVLFVFWPPCSLFVHGTRGRQESCLGVFMAPCLFAQLASKKVLAFSPLSLFNSL